MFQGNPFETELVVKDRTAQVQEDVQSSQVPGRAQSHNRAHRWWKSLIAGIHTPKHNAPNPEPLKDRR